MQSIFEALSSIVSSAKTSRYLGGLPPRKGYRRIKVARSNSIYFYKKIDDKPKFFKKRKKK